MVMVLNFQDAFYADRTNSLIRAFPDRHLLYQEKYTDSRGTGSLVLRLCMDFCFYMCM